MTTHTPPSTSFSAMVLDVTLSPNKIVLMDTGNYPNNSTFLNQTWLLNGTGTPDWTNTGATLIDANGPLPGRTDMIMSFDGSNVMLFGGRGTSSQAGVFADSWSWNGTAWSKQSPTTSPSGRYKAKAAYLAGGGAVMFGGENLGHLLTDTFVWSAGNWTQITSANIPPGRTGHVIAANTTQLVMFGGKGTSYQFNDLWKYTNAGGWTQLSPTNSPSVRSDACMAWDSVNSVFVMFGGQNEYKFLNDTYKLDPAANSGQGAWTKVSVANGSGPAGSIGAQMAFDTVSGKTIMFGGVSATAGYPINATWSFDGAANTWTQL